MERRARLGDARLLFFPANRAAERNKIRNFVAIKRAEERYKDCVQTPTDNNIACADACFFEDAGAV
jgi:hypothetical protein